MSAQRNLVVLIGLGNMAGAHLEALLRSIERGTFGDLRLGICTSNEAARRGDLRGKPQGNNLGVQVRDTVPPELLEYIVFFDSFDAVLADRRVFACIVARETIAHFEIASKLLEANIHVLVEKPLTLHPEEGKMLSWVRASSRAKIVVGHILPFFPQYAGLDELLRACSNKQGFPVGYMRRLVKRSNPINDPRNRALVRSAVYDLIVHDAHVLRKNFGRPTKMQIHRRRMHPDAKDLLSYVELGLRFENGGQVTVISGAIEDESPAFQHAYLLNLGDRKFVYDPLENPVAMVTPSDSSVKPYPLPLPSSPFDADIAPIAAEQKVFFDYILGKRDDAGALDFDLARDAVVIAHLADALASKGRAGEVEIPWEKGYR